MKTFIFNGFSAGRIVVTAETKEDAEKKALQIDYDHSSGNIPDVEYVGQKIWEVDGSQSGLHQFDTLEEAKKYYNEISQTDNCTMCAIIIK